MARRLATIIVAPVKQNNSKTLPRQSMRIATWNVRTMRTGLPDTCGGSQSYCAQDLRKTALIDAELSRLNISVCALQETRLPDDGSLRESTYTFFWKEKSPQMFANTEWVLRYATIYCDFNAHVGGDYTAWPNCIGYHGIGKLNENGQRLLEFCSEYSLCVTNTYFKGKTSRKVSWKHPRSGHWHQLDIVLSRSKNLRDILHTRSFHSADCNTDHSLVAAHIAFTPKRIHSSKVPGRRKLNLSNIRNDECVQKFECLANEMLAAWDGSAPINVEWNNVRKLLTESAGEVFGYQKTKSHDWFAENVEHLQPLLDSKRNAALRHRLNPSTDTDKALRATKAALQRSARYYANLYWSELGRTIQTCADRGDIGGVYEGVKRALGPIKKKSAPLKDANGFIITDNQKQLERWVEHYTGLYSRPVYLQPEAVLSMPKMDVWTELDDPPSLEDFIVAVNQLKRGKSPGKDGTQAEIIKLECAKPILRNLLLKCWEAGDVPQDMRDANIITLYKGKGDRGDCNCYRGNCKKSVESRILEKTPLFVAFVDLNKAFDTVSREGLYSALGSIWCPPKLLSLIKSFHEDMRGTIVFNGQSSESFDVRRGVRQGCVLAPTLFGIYFSLLIYTAFGDDHQGIHLHTRTDGNIFNISLLKSKRNREDLFVVSLLFADDAAFVANSAAELQSMLDKFSQACSLYAMYVNTKKTVVLTQGIQEAPLISLNGTLLEVVDRFCYLGSTVSNNLSLEAEIDSRIGKAATMFGRLSTRVWYNKYLTIKTKMVVFQASILSILLYGAETWTTYAKQESRLNTFYMRCLRKILGISWRDRVTNERILEIAQLPSLTAFLKQKRLRWLGHVHRMEPSRLPRRVLLGAIANAKRDVGRPLLRFKDCAKRDMATFQIDHRSWEKLATNKSDWRKRVMEGRRVCDDAWLQRLADKRRKRHLGGSNNTPAAPPSFIGSEHCMQQAFLKQGVPNSAINTMLSSLSKNTINQYSSSFKK
ncbi:uncharacterized protein LOC131844918 [Achroia grisella]|uniref:uncharacterized protein LOC131844918 n=1 Tax=Achroia grisella TaxID=688607 RepID=UPI0027D2B39B|nr:uncharacterized protein LOC131844918 [Achroia grisella]